MVARRLSIAGICCLIPLFLWTIRRADREIASQQQLSPQTVAATYLVYVMHATVTFTAIYQRWGAVPRRRGLRLMLGIPVACLGLVFYGLGIHALRTFRRTSGLEADELIQDGVYRWSRNPQLAGWGVTLAGLAVMSGSSVALALVGVFLAMSRVQITREERMLESAFGDRYRRYRAHVPRFFGVPQNGHSEHTHQKDSR